MKLKKLYLIESEYWTNTNEELINNKIMICVSKEEAEKKKTILLKNYKELFLDVDDAYQSNDYEIKISEVNSDHIITSIFNRLNRHKQLNLV